MRFSLIGTRSALRHVAVWILGATTVAMVVLSFNGLGSSILNSHNSQAQQGQAQSTEDVVATVNSQQVTRSQYEAQLNQWREQQEQQGQQLSSSETGEAHAMVLTRLINMQVMEQLAKASGVTVPQSQYNAAYSQQLVGLKKTLSLPDNASVDDVNAALASRGLSADTLIDKSAIEGQLLLTNYQAMLAHSSKASDQAVNDYFKQVHTRHILISDKSRPEAQAKQQAEQIIAKLKAGADFATLAKADSDDPGTKGTGGDDGWKGETSGYVPEFMKAAMALKDGQVTPEPVYSPQFGYFVIQTLASKETLPKDFAKSKDKYTAQVSQYLQDQAEQTSMQDAIKAAKINVTDPELAADRLLFNNPGQAVSPQDLQTAVADYNKALTATGESDKSDIYVQLAAAYQQLNQPDKQISALQQALSAEEDPQVRMNLGQLYQSKKDNANALKQFELAQNDASNSDDSSMIGVHFQLQQDFKKLGKPDLAAKEQSWISDFMKREKQMQATRTPPRLPPGVTPPSAPSTVPAPSHLYPAYWMRTE